MTWYSGVKSRSTATPVFDLGRSLTCPKEAFTENEFPRYFLMVRAFAGDSTITRDFGIPLKAPPDYRFTKYFCPLSSTNPDSSKLNNTAPTSATRHPKRRGEIVDVHRGGIEGGVNPGLPIAQTRRLGPLRRCLLTS